MTRDEMKQRLDAGDDPLDVAIDKWVDVRDGKGSNLGTSNCALCQKYGFAEGCHTCPADEGKSCCNGLVSKYGNYFRRVGSVEAKRVAQEIIDYLRSKRLKFINAVVVNKEEDRFQAICPICTGVQNFRTSKPVVKAGIDQDITCLVCGIRYCCSPLRAIQAEEK